jgi:NADPH-dependent curcumin reductase CurA
MTLSNAQIRMAARPVGLPKASDRDYVEEPTPKPGDGQFLADIQQFPEVLLRLFRGENTGKLVLAV